MKYCVYMHRCPNGKVYIGVTGKTPSERWKGGHGYSNNRHFKSAIEKYGWDNIEHIILNDNLEKETAYQLEKEYIKKYNSTDRSKGYNVSTGGEASAEGFHHTKEAREKIGKASRGVKRKPESIRKARLAHIISIEVYDIDANHLGTFESLTEAQKFTGVNNSNISATCKGKYKQFKGYIFRYSGDKTPVEKIRSHRKPVRMYSLDGAFIKEFKSVKEAARTMNLHDTHIADCCKGKYTQSGGFIWEYA